MPKNVKRLFSAHYEKKYKNEQKKCKIIWSVQKKAVLLHPLSPKKRRGVKMIFERLSIHNKM